MAVQLKITHETGYKYAGIVVASYNEARLTPVTAPGQLVISSRLDVTPAPYVFRYRDYWGTQVTSFDIAEPHDALTVTATSVVQIDRTPAAPRWMTWEGLADPVVADRMCEWLTVNDSVAVSTGFANALVAVREAANGPSDYARAVCQLVHDEVDYVVGETHVHSHAAEAWDAKAGVCQDLTHLAIGALREAGIPARYVSGYLYPGATPAIGETVAGESHAWLEWWDGTWIGFDPTNMSSPDERYVVLATGRDYADVPPLAGIYSGGETSAMFVEVKISRVE